MIKDRHLLLFFLGLIVCLSLWQITGPSLVYMQTAPPFYTLLTANTTQTSYPMQQLPPDDYTRLINLINFNFLMLNSVCNASAPILLVLVHTSPANYAKRMTIRETWGQFREGLRVVFMLGKVNDSVIAAGLEEESRKYKDIAQGNFLDSYRNMTYKHVMVFKYAIYHCPRANYLLKTDDDIFVNSPALMEFLTQDLSPFGATNLLLCNRYRNSRVLRSYRSKWHVGEC